MRSCSFYVSPVEKEHAEMVNEELDLQLKAGKSFFASHFHTNISIT